MKIKIKRAYDIFSPDDGKRILVDRLWPRGISKDNARIDYWAKDIAPSNELRKWYNHDSGRWDEFKQRYFSELSNNQVAVEELVKQMNQNTTFIFSSKETRLNNAYALKEYLVSYVLNS